MNIAVIIGEVGFISRKNIIEGMLGQSNKKNINIFLFTCEGWKYSENQEYGEGEFNIYNLPDFSNYDGAIVDIDSIHDQKTRKSILNRLKNTNIPTVSINLPIDVENSAVIQFENQKGIKNIVEHLVKVHNIDSIHYISGPIHNWEAIKRRAAFCEAAIEMGLTCGPEDISYGDFQFHSGQKVVSALIEKGREIPKAIIAANDYMAIGAMIELEKNGYRIPEDVVVTGYDDKKSARCVHPRLTTVNREERSVGRKAINLLLDLIAGHNEKEVVYIEGKNIFAESCGCPAEKNRHKSQIIMDLAEERLFTGSNLEALKTITISFSNMKSFSEFSMQLQRTIEQMELDYFYLCICGTRENYYEEIDILASGKEIERDLTKYMEYGSIPLAYENGTWNSYPEFRIKDILPEDSQMKQTGGYHIIMPVHYGDICIGYCVIGNYVLNLDQRFLQHLVLSINNALGNIREHDIMSTMLSRINEKWLYDELTGIYNRAGLWQKSENYIKEAQKAGRKIVVYFIDLDGLKSINDELGHEYGDKYIKSMATILSDNKLQDDKTRDNKAKDDKAKDNKEKDIRTNNALEDIVARYGGDEYIILSSYINEEDISAGLAEINKKIEEYNESDTEQKLSASIGYQKQENGEIDIKKMIELADKEMYIAKKKKKMVL